MSSGFLTLQSAWFTRLRKILLLLCGEKSLQFLFLSWFCVRKRSMRHILFSAWERKLRRELCRYQWINLIRCLKVGTYVKGVSIQKSCLFILLDLQCCWKTWQLKCIKLKRLINTLENPIKRTRIVLTREIFENSRHENIFNVLNVLNGFLYHLCWLLAENWVSRNSKIEKSQLSKFPRADSVNKQNGEDQKSVWKIGKTQNWRNFHEEQSSRNP